MGLAMQTRVLEKVAIVVISAAVIGAVAQVVRMQAHMSRMDVIVLDLASTSKEMQLFMRSGGRFTAKEGDIVLGILGEIRTDVALVVRETTRQDEGIKRLRHKIERLEAEVWKGKSMPNLGDAWIGEWLDPEALANRE